MLYAVYEVYRRMDKRELVEGRQEAIEQSIVKCAESSARDVEWGGGLMNMTAVVTENGPLKLEALMITVADGVVVVYPDGTIAKATTEGV